MERTGAMIFQLRVYGLPVPQGRPRAFVTPSGHASVYDPKKSKDWKNLVREQVISAERPTEPWRGAIELSLTFFLPRPVSLPKKVIHHTKRPDCDNLAKAVKDALKGLVYHDDSQVVELHVEKGYDSTPGVEIHAMELS